MSKKITSIRGMLDILPVDTAYWQFLETILKNTATQYGYQEIKLPFLERTELFARSVGEVTDIVEKEMYTFLDRNGDSLSLRPEGTASCVRAVIEHQLLQQGPQRLWYLGPMFRYERPQKGRYRQFYHFGCETFGFAGAEIEVEIISMVNLMLQRLGIAGQVQLEINTLGNSKVREFYRQALVTYFSAHFEKLDEDSQKRLERNPLRILDSKNPQMQELIAGAPQLADYLDPDSAAHFQKVCRLLDQMQIPYVHNQRLVRGLDYYSDTVFEWVTKELGSQGSVAAGGRYNDLVGQLGGAAAPAVGFAIGLDRMILMLQNNQPEHAIRPDAYFITMGEAAELAALQLAENLRRDLPHLQLILNLGEKNMKNQFKKADKSQATWALILGEEEVAQQQIALKNLRDPNFIQQKLSYAELLSFLSKFKIGPDVI